MVDPAPRNGLWMLTRDTQSLEVIALRHIAEGVPAYVQLHTVDSATRPDTRTTWRGLRFTHDSNPQSTSGAWYEFSSLNELLAGSTDGLTQVDYPLGGRSIKLNYSRYENRGYIAYAFHRPLEGLILVSGPLPTTKETFPAWMRLTEPVAVPDCFSLHALGFLADTKFLRASLPWTAVLKPQIESPPLIAITGLTGSGIEEVLASLAQDSRYSVVPHEFCDGLVGAIGTPGSLDPTSRPHLVEHHHALAAVELLTRANAARCGKRAVLVEHGRPYEAAFMPASSARPASQAEVYEHITDASLEADARVYAGAILLKTPAPDVYRARVPSHHPRANSYSRVLDFSNRIHRVWQTCLHNDRCIVIDEPSLVDTVERVRLSVEQLSGAGAIL